MTTCDYAACTALASSDLDGWQFCTRHLREHRRPQLTAIADHVDGLLMPSLDLTPLLRALTRDQDLIAESGAA